MTDEEKKAALDSEKLTYILNGVLTNQAMLSALLDSQAHLMQTVLNTDYETAKAGLNDLVERSRQIVIKAAEEHLQKTLDALNDVAPVQRATVRKLSRPSSPEAI